MALYALHKYSIVPSIVLVHFPVEVERLETRPC